MLELYQFEECEYSAQVRQKMSEWGIDCILRNVSKDKSKRERLKRLSRRNETPTLVDSSCDVIIAGDEQKIIAHLAKFHRLKRPQRRPASGP
ncbi:MAG: glutathione S-transferase N-terminal domain-containing protein [Nitrospiraceae bacterium]